MTDFSIFLLGFIFNLFFAVILVRFVYYPRTQNKRYIFTFLAFNTVIYFVLSFLKSVEVGVGVGFGLFAIFSILRYRTDPIPVREMTYLFIIAALPVMNSAATTGTVWPQLIAANLAILLLMWVLEKEWGFHYEASKKIIYEKMDLIHSDRREELKADLEERTGIKIKRINIGKVNFLKDTAEVKIFYDEEETGIVRHVDEPEAVVVQYLDEE
ncbi:MAG TPA: DUF4956 domain-containing protein [Anaerolineaceae bacterium]|nr:DUF4956 domain-containing protein [Anaerolineaceae bacterium]